MPALKPVSTGSEMNRATKPSRKTAARTSANPTSTASVVTVAAACAAEASGDTWLTSAAVRIPIVVVVLTLRRRELPSIAYAIIGRIAV